VFGWDSAYQFFRDRVNPDRNKSDARPVLLAYEIANFFNVPNFLTDENMSVFLRTMVF
jgi:hypothetical protein